MTSQRKLPRALLPPLIVLMLGVLIALASIFLAKREPRAAFAPIDLRPGVARTVEFKAAYDGRYEVGLQMDQQVAKSLFPCAVDASLFDNQSVCAGRDMPVELSLTLVGGGAELSRKVYSAKGVRGGRYGDRQTYTLGVDYVHLSSGRDYRLTVQPLRDGSSLAPAHRHLVVEVDVLAQKGEMVVRSLALLVAVALGLIGALWLALTYAFRAWSERKRAKTSSA